MSKLSIKEVAHIAHLAGLNLSQDEITKFQKQLSEVVDYVEELDEVDISNTLPTSQTTGLENIYRVDKANSIVNLTQDKALSGTEKTQNGFFKVPKILRERIAK